MAAAVPIAIVAGTMLQAAAQSQAAAAKEKQMQMEARQATQNAANAEVQRDYNANRLAMSSEQKFGEMRVGYAASGITSDSGSVFDILRQSHTNAERDRQTILYGGDIQAANYRNRADAAGIGAANARTGGQLNTYATLFGGVTNAYGKYGGSSSQLDNNYSGELDA